jgi:hypothetical protein
MRMTEPPTAPLIQAKASATPNSPVQVSPQFESTLNSLNSGGTPLDAQSRAFFEPRFGEDFSQVRLHTNTSAAHMAEALDAKAFTLGNNIAFGASSTLADKNLLGHELAHVIQQRGPSADASQAKRIQRWPAGIHQKTIENTLKDKLEMPSLKTLMEQQARIDREQTVFDQPKHAMSGKDLVTGEEVTKEVAIKMANAFVNGWLTRAHGLSKKTATMNDNTQPGEAMVCLGNAIHTLQDATSPTHSGFQTFELAAGIPRPFGGISHSTGEILIIKSKDRTATLEGVTRWAYSMFKTGEIPEKVFDERTGDLLLPSGAAHKNLSRFEVQAILFPEPTPGNNKPFMPENIHSPRQEPQGVTILEVRF